MDNPILKATLEVEIKLLNKHKEISSYSNRIKFLKKIKTRKMKKIIIGTSIGFIIGVALTIFVLNFVIVIQIPKDHIRITVKNNSSNIIKELKLIHEKGENSLKWIKQDKDITSVFYTSGENSFKIKVLFENDSVLVSNEKYIESGADITQIVTNEKITDEIK